MEEQQQPQPPSRTTGADVQLIIKAPSSKYEDFKISCQLSWTIFELKTHISEEYPSKPVRDQHQHSFPFHVCRSIIGDSIYKKLPTHFSCTLSLSHFPFFSIFLFLHQKTSDQRLIYSGHLLKDEQHLRDIIELSGDKNDSAAAAAANNTYTFHLVCANRSTTAKPLPTTSAATSSNSTPSTSSSSSGTMPPNATPSTSSASASASNSGPSTSTSSNSNTNSNNNLPFNPTFEDLPWSNLFAPANGENPLDPNNHASLERTYQQAYYAMMQQYCQYMNYHYSTVGRASGGSSSATTGAPAPDYAGYLAFANTYLRGMNNPAAGGGGNQGGGGGLAPNVPPPPFLAAPNAGGLNPPNQNQNNNVPAAAGAAGVVNRNNRNNNNRPGAAAVAGAAAPFAAVAAAAANVDDLNNRDWMDMVSSVCQV